jgi:hypothetical protein
MDIATLQQRITEAETAMHSLMMGSRVSEAGAPDGSRVSYTQTDLPRLREYLQWLKAQLVQAQQGAARPIYFEYGR